MKRILFVDDEPRILEGIRRMLYGERKQWEMEFAIGGAAALQACERGSFDVVVSDMRMPIMDGVALLTQLRNRFPGIARIVLSGHCESETATRAVPVAHRFLAKPCSSADLVSAIEAVCALQDVLSGARIREVIGSIGQLPPLSATYAALTQALMNPETPISKVAEIVQQDMALTAKVLQLVNSAFFGLPQEVTSLPGAVSRLGMETIKNLVLVAETFKAFLPHRCIPASAHEFLQQHAQRVASIAGKLPVDRSDRDVTILAGLLHDIGRLIFASNLPDRFCKILELSRKRGCEIHEAEEELMGTSHAEVGAYLLGLWGIPHLAVEAIAHHHRPTRIAHSGFDTCTALYVAELLASESCVAQDSRMRGLRSADQECLEMLGVMGRMEEFWDLAQTGTNN
ncbi:MAG: response regulator [Terriglobales bacterium]